MPASRRPAGFRPLRARLWSTASTLLARDTMVVTNAIAFNFLLCLFPLLLVVIALVQQLPGGRRVSTAVLLVVGELIPFEREALARSLQGLRRTAAGLEAVSLLLIIWGSSGIFMPVEMALGRAWGTRPRPFLQSRLLAFAMTVAGGLLAIFSTAFTVAARSYQREWPLIAEYGARTSALSMTLLLFYMVYRVIPSPPVPARVALKAALWAGSAWEVAKYLFVANLARANLQAFYGPLAFSVALVLWAYVSSLVLVFGALMVPASSPIEMRRAPLRAGLRRSRGGG
ncbi:MAG TPA: YihY/virulence factor BrkB family protein [Vicinamibacteria bacterium]|nr:YihY/virulence factor BrkB family protein [Vicinamibacteria bacterium]